MEEIDLRNIQELFYTSKTNKELCELIELLGPDFDLSKFPDSYYQVYKKLGIELVFNKQHYFERIIIHQKSKECLKFHFPFGLNLDLKRSDVERILGIPERSGGGSKRMNCWVGYPEKGIFIDYQTKNQNNNTATIAYISLKPVENELSRIRFITKTEIHIFFQARSTIYTSGVIADLLGLPADRVDENDHNLFEIFSRKIHI